MEKIFKVGKESKSGKIAGAIRAEIGKNEKLVLRMIGPGSTWQGMKAIALSGYGCLPKMNKITIKDQEVFVLDLEMLKDIKNPEVSFNHYSVERKEENTLVKEEKKEKKVEEKNNGD